MFRGDNNMRVLFTGFKGVNNSSKILLDKIKCDKKDKLYLTNSFKTSVLELESKLKQQHYDLVISLGQLKLNQDVVRIELNGIGDKIYRTKYDYSLLEEKLVSAGFKVIISNKTNYLCNNIYYYGLKMIEENNIDAKMIFIHIPKINSITDVLLLADVFNNFIN